MTPALQMHYSWLGFAYAVLSLLLQLFIEKWFDIVLAMSGTWLGYLLAKRHIEHFIRGVVEQLQTKYLDLNRQVSFHKAVAAMLPELPRFHLRPTNAFSSNVTIAVGEFTTLSTALDPTHTPEKSMELVGKEAYELAAKLIAKDMGFKEAIPVPNYEWSMGIGDLPTDWVMDEQPDLSELPCIDMR